RLGIDLRISAAPRGATHPVPRAASISRKRGRLRRGRHLDPVSPQPHRLTGAVAIALVDCGIEYHGLVRVVLSRVVRSAFAVVGAPDADTERRSRLLLVMAAAM